MLLNMKTLVVALLLATCAAAAAPPAAPKSSPAPRVVRKARPKWTKARPHFEKRGEKRIAVAVGRAKAANLALARTAAEDNGRAALLKLIQGKGPAESGEGLVNGAQAVEFFEAAQDVVYVRMEMAAP